MSVATGSLRPMNGLPRRPTEVNEALEYEKILSIYNQVIAGNHPRLKLSGSVNAPIRANLVQPPSQPPTTAVLPAAITAVPSLPKPAQPPSLAVPQINHVGQELPVKAPKLNASTFSSRPVPSKPPPSELDPIFLTKSDGLVRAEIQLQRQRVERVLREQVEQKRVDARHKPSFAEAKPDFDVAEVLTKALDLVKPVVLDEPRAVNDNGSASDSFDENSFYSSKAPDSTPRDGDESQKSSLSTHQVQPVDKDEVDADRLVDRRSDGMQQVDLTDSPYRVVPRPDFSVTNNHHYRENMARTRVEGPVLAPAVLDEDDDEPEYSPPEPTQPAHLKDNRGVVSREPYAERASRVNGRHGNDYPSTRRYESPVEADVRIVRSHITSPFAPQPSRVSPLAVAKAPPTPQNRRHRQDHVQQRRPRGPEYERASPDMAPAATQPRKKRKIQDNRKATRRRAMGSPDPIIKDEPVSPPPFHNVPPLGASRTRPAATNPIYIDVEAPQEARYFPERQNQPSGRQIMSDVEGETPHSAPRLVSGNALDDAPRANQDLRRVVSVQNLPSREYTEPNYSTPTRLARAPSYAAGEGVIRPEARLYEGQAHSYERPQMLEERPLVSPLYRESELGHRYAIQPMAPPPPQRRIVVDEYGQQFYETIHPARTSAAPPSGRRFDVDNYSDLALPRNGVSRAVSVLEEFPRETRYVQQEMPPPPMIYRRVAEVSRPTTSDPRYVSEAPLSASSEIRYIMREPVEMRPAPPSESVHMYNYPTRHPAYVEDNMAIGESVRRVSSVRPIARAFNEPQEVFQRVQSTRSEARPMSVVPENRPQVRRGHMQVEAPRYEIRRTAEGDRYYRIDDGGRMMLDAGIEPTPAYVPRY